MRFKRIAMAWLSIYMITVIVTAGRYSQGGIFKVSESDLGLMCVQAVYPSASRGTPRQVKKEEKLSETEKIILKSGSTEEIKETEDRAVVQKSKDKQEKALETAKRKPLVIIYHTHATEAYQPIAPGTFRTTEEKGSVRDVGNELAAELERLGIGVIHDKTLHDAESYNQSYTRSLETITRLVAENPSAVIVIDLHRDAAPYAGCASKKVTVNGETASSWSLVVGQGNENAAGLNQLAADLIAKAEELYPGFGGRIIKKEYKYNQYVLENAILLEAGNNESNIRDVRITGKYFAHVLKGVMQDRGYI